MVVLIDNDPLVRASWEYAAKKVNLEIKSFHSVEDFLSLCRGVSKESEIYIDSELDDGVKGEVEAIKIYERGYHNLFLASGHQFSRDELPSYIKGAVSKRAPF